MSTNNSNEPYAPSNEVLRIAVEEQRRFHNELTSSFAATRAKILYFIGASLALLTFLYAGASNPDGHKLTVHERLFIPHDLYGLIFYFAGLTLVLYALAKLIHGAKPDSLWSVPFEQEDFITLKDTDERIYLEKLKNEYVKTTASNLAVHDRKSCALKDAFYPLLLGAIVLVVLRYFQ
ncbi:MAG TPA: hypothetical protein VLI54_06115 [Bacillota bacterium]|nr:hypothetical protein [Bacillota bacterium]